MSKESLKPLSTIIADIQVESKKIKLTTDLQNCIDQLGSITKLFQTLKPNLNTSQRLSFLLRQNLLLLYTAFPILGLRFSVAVLSFIHETIFSPPPNLKGDGNNAYQEKLQTALLSGILDFLESHPSSENRSIVATVLYPVLQLVFFPALSSHHQKGPALMYTLYQLLSETVTSHPANQIQLRDGDILGGSLIGTYLAHTKDFLVIESLLELFAKLLPSKSSKGGIEARKAFVKQVFDPAKFSCSATVLEIFEKMTTNDWESIFIRIIEALGAADISFPQTFTISNFTLQDSKACNIERLYVDHRGLVANIDEGAQIETFKALFSTIQHIKVIELSRSIATVTVALLLPPSIGQQTITPMTVNDVTFNISNTHTARFLQVLKTRGVKITIQQRRKKLSKAEKSIELGTPLKRSFVPVSTQDKARDLTRRTFYFIIPSISIVNGPTSTVWNANNTKPHGFYNAPPTSPLFSCKADADDIPEAVISLAVGKNRRLSTSHPPAPERSSPQYDSIFGTTDEELTDLSDVEATISKKIHDKVSSRSISVSVEDKMSLPKTELRKPTMDGGIKSSSHGPAQQAKYIPRKRKAPDSPLSSPTSAPPTPISRKENVQSNRHLTRITNKMFEFRLTDGRNLEGTATAHPDEMQASTVISTTNVSVHQKKSESSSTAAVCDVEQPTAKRHRKALDVKNPPVKKRYDKKAHHTISAARLSNAGSHLDQDGTEERHNASEANTITESYKNKPDADESNSTKENVACRPKRSVEINQKSRGLLGRPKKQITENRKKQPNSNAPRRSARIATSSVKKRVVSSSSESEDLQPIPSTDREWERQENLPGKETQLSKNLHCNSSQDSGERKETSTAIPDSGNVETTETLKLTDCPVSLTDVNFLSDRNSQASGTDAPATETFEEYLAPLKGSDGDIKIEPPVIIDLTEDSPRRARVHSSGKTRTIARMPDIADTHQLCKDQSERLPTNLTYRPTEKNQPRVSFVLPISRGSDSKLDRDISQSFNSMLRGPNNTHLTDLGASASQEAKTQERKQNGYLLKKYDIDPMARIIDIIREITEVIAQKASHRFDLVSRELTASGRGILSEATLSLEAMFNDSVNHFNKLTNLESQYAKHHRGIIRELENSLKLEQDLCGLLSRTIQEHNRGSLSRAFPSSLFEVPHPRVVSNVKLAL